MDKYTIKQFTADYPTDEVCLDKIFQLRYGNMYLLKVSIGIGLLIKGEYLINSVLEGFTGITF